MPFISHEALQTLRVSACTFLIQNPTHWRKPAILNALANTRPDMLADPNASSESISKMNMQEQDELDAMEIS